ncbi:unnamed protein product [Protopolystoma xenopodis]|uniref:Uncharacterized protein n=1 Tax=Protopolystoma xenopodis TaxID=117903 RepID=A0A3S5BFI1_9PLAT|nr:unnamed protein product [Protopolystoma xenopodis]
MDANWPTRRSTQLSLRQSLITSSSVHTETECLTHQHGGTFWQLVPFKRTMAKCVRVACAGHGSTSLTCSLFVIRPSHTSSFLSLSLPMTHLPTSLGGYGARGVGEGGTRGAD